MDHLRRCLILPALAGTCIASTGATASGDEVQQLRDEVAVLRGELAELRRGESEQWLTEQRAEEIRGLVHEVLADAETRASLRQSPMTAGWDDHFFVGSADGNFMLEISGQIQFRHVYNRRDDSGDDDNRWGFENRRTKMAFEGFVVDPSWEYAVQGAFDRSDGGPFELEIAQIEKDLGNGWSLRFGQFKPPFLREELVSSKRQLAVERSLVNERFNQDFAQGIQLGWQGDQVLFAVMYSDGFASRNTAALVEDTELAFTGRVEYLGAGTWRQFRDFTSWSDDEFGWLLGAAAHYERDEYGTATGPEEERFTWTVDASMEFGGANVYAAFISNHLEEADLDQYAFVIQGGFFIVPDEWELFARYEWGDDDSIGGAEELNVVTVGFNRYFAKHALKWTTDVGYAFDEISTAWDSSGAGWLDDAPEQDGQIVVRSQFQLLF